MAATLARLLNLQPHSSDLICSNLEELSGFAGEDNRFLADIKYNVYKKILDLKLDPKHTKPKELYYAIGSKFDDGNLSIAKLFGNFSSLDPDTSSKQLISLAEQIVGKHKLWAIKHSVAKNIIKNHPPKKLLRHLKYRSVESLVKRENICEIIAACYTIESSSWLNGYFKSFEKLSPTSFEVRNIELIVMPAKKYGSLKNRNISLSLENGTIAIWPANNQQKQYPLARLVKLLRLIDQAQANSIYIMSQQTKSDFGRWVSKFLSTKNKKLFSFFSQTVSPEDIFYYINSHPENTGQFFDSYIQAVEPVNSSTSRMISLIHPSLRWWEETDYLADVSNNSPISFNITDSATSKLLNANHNTLAYSGLTKDIWKVILSRYLRYPGVQNFVIQKLKQPASYSKKSSGLIKTNNAIVVPG